jgi:hypothetical protein
VSSLARKFKICMVRRLLAFFSVVSFHERMEGKACSISRGVGVSKSKVIVFESRVRILGLFAN